METSQTINELSKALLTFHKEVSVIKKTEVNPFFKSKYADLATILKGINAPLQKAELAVVQVPECGNKLTTRVIHTASGEWLEGTYDMTPKDASPQSQGSAITYMRRYAISAILGLNVDEDDDGNSASGFALPKATKKYEVKSTDAKCGKCGANMTISKTTGKEYCVDKCWLKKQESVDTAIPPIESYPW